MWLRKIFLPFFIGLIALPLVITSQSIPSHPAIAQINDTDRDGIIPLWSPDGNYILVFRRAVPDVDTGVVTELWLVDTDSFEATNLPYAQSILHEVEWSPDSKWIAYTSTDDRDEPVIHNLWIMNPDGEQSRNLTANMEAHVSSFQWSPDGKSLVFATARSRFVVEDTAIWVIDVDSGELTKITQDFDVQYHSPDWSYDGSKIAFLSRDETNKDLIWIVDYDGSTISLPRHISINETILEIRWSPAEDLLAINTLEGIGIVDLNGEMTILFESMEEPTLVLSWSPDGTYLAFASGRESSYTFDIFLVEMQSRRMQNLTVELNEGLLNPISWSPDSQHIALEAKIDGDKGLWIMDLRDNKLTRVPLDFWIKSGN